MIGGWETINICLRDLKFVCLFVFCAFVQYKFV